MLSLAAFGSYLKKNSALNEIPVSWSLLKSFHLHSKASWQSKKNPEFRSSRARFWPRLCGLIYNDS